MFRYPEIKSAPPSAAENSQRLPRNVHHLTDAIKIRSATPAKIRAIGTTRINTAMIVKIRTKREFSVDLI
jgi:hypothetical protein